MAFQVRPARPDDIDSIAAWTNDTFSWGDYVAGSLGDWISDPELNVLVAVESDDLPRGLSVVRMLSPDEGWLSAARVHPTAQRKGIGTLLNDTSVDWVKTNGGRVARLAAESDNEPARSQVEKLGYRRTSTWVFGVLPEPALRKPARSEKLSPVGRSDVDPAWMYWSTSEMFEAGRGLKASAWTWRRARVGDIGAAAGDRRLYTGPAGWVVVEMPEEGHLDVVWVATSASDFPRLVAGVDTLAVDLDRSRVVYRIPDTGWSREALRRVGSDVSEIHVYAKAV